MGIIKQGILGGFLGKVGGVIGGNFKGIATMRAMPVSVANPRTPAQVNNRTRFSAITGLANAIGLTIIHSYWNRAAVKMSGFNLFCSVNKDVIDDNLNFYPMNLKVSNGTLTPPVIDTKLADFTSKTVVVGFEYPLVGDHLSTDICQLVCVNMDGTKASYSQNYLYDALTMTAPLPDGIGVGELCYVFLISRRADGSKTSSTAWGQTTVIAV